MASLLEPERRKREVDMSEQRKKYVPDGEEVYTEWKEGPQTVIERRSGPGEEPEVEVIDNDDKDNVETVASDIVHGHGGKTLGREVHRSIEKVEQGAEHGVEKVEHAFKRHSPH